MGCLNFLFPCCVSLDDCNNQSQHRIIRNKSLKSMRAKTFSHDIIIQPEQEVSIPINDGDTIAINCIDKHFDRWPVHSSYIKINHKTKRLNLHLEPVFQNEDHCFWQINVHRKDMLLA